MGLKKRGEGDGEGKKRWLVEKHSSEITDLTGPKILKKVYIK
jgi:hypothetical protein